ncbi:MAG: hypothetical protein PQJ50_17500, partial [Spirochaetales bacterium]|nr:hypothetical protein [Spirochaetales bacterium]
MGRQSLSGSSSGFRNNFNRKREEKDGCLVAISTFTALSLIIWLYGKAGTAGFIYILFLTAAFAFLYGLFLFYKTKTNARKAGEAVSLYQKGEYREAYAVALSISGQNCDAALIAGL